jgi:serine/threonine protein kinase
MLLGIAHIHSLNIVHRDIKPDNFLVGGSDGKTVKLGDFGLAAYVPPGGKVEGVCGTSPFMSPEMLRKREVDLKADVWSFGVLAYSFMCGHFPYDSKDGSSKSMKLAIADGNAPRCRKPWLTSSACAFLKAVLCREPCARLSATSALRNEFIITNLEAKYDNEVSLRGILASLGQTGLFDPPSLVRKSTIDGLCDDIEKGRLQRNTKTLTQSQIDAFIGSTSDEIDEFVESFWFPDGSINDYKDDDTSPKTSATTNYENFPDDDSSSKTTAHENYLEDDLSSKATACEDYPENDSSSKATAHDNMPDYSNVADAGSK